MPHAGSTRWCPTPEQLMILEEMYRGGIRTPNASQIQQITSHLSFYGKIEGKNVFYWFQNHKARDRQKLRRLSRYVQLQQQQPMIMDPALPWFPQQIPTHFFDQGCIGESTQVTNFLCKLETQEKDDIEMRPTVAFGNECMVTMDAADLPPCNSPPKTLELFPIQSTGLKEDRAMKGVR